MVKKEGKRFSRIPDLFARKRVYLGQRHCAYKRLAAKTQNCSPFPFFWLKKERKGINGTWGRHSDGRALGGAESAGCVRRLDGSLVPAIRITYRVSLRSSSSREPRYPSTGVVSGFLVSCFFVSQKTKTKGLEVFNASSPLVFFFLALFLFSNSFEGIREKEEAPSGVRNGRPLTLQKRRSKGTPTFRVWVTRGRNIAKSTPASFVLYKNVNDPSAGSPTETLLRLLLPLNGKVQPTLSNPATRLPGSREGPKLRGLRRTVRSVGATGGVYKGQGRNQRGLMTRAY